MRRFCAPVEFLPFSERELRSENDASESREVLSMKSAIRAGDYYWWQSALP
jgi:hypothetical protein